MRNITPYSSKGQIASSIIDSATIAPMSVNQYALNGSGDMPLKSVFSTVPLLLSIFYAMLFVDGATKYMSP